jgi:hypothetical protein
MFVSSKSNDPVFICKDAESDLLSNLNYGKLLYENFENQLVKFCHINFVYLVSSRLKGNICLKVEVESQEVSTLQGHHARLYLPCMKLVLQNVIFANLQIYLKHLLPTSYYFL